MAWNNKKYKEELKFIHTSPYRYDKLRKIVVPEDPKRFAAQAMAYGTLLALVGTGTVVLATVFSWKM